MFIGHFAVAFGAKKFAPEVSLGMLFLACQLADLIWPSLVLLGIETFEISPGITKLTPLNFVHYPYSHSLVAMALWGLIFAGLYMLLQRPSQRVAIVISLLVVSHWVLDVLTHRADMPISFNEATLIGLGLWNYPMLAVGIELLIYAAGLWIYARVTVAKNRRGRIGFWALVIFLLLVYVANLAGPPPPSVAAVAWSAQALWLIVLWGFWIDAHRAVRKEL